MTRSWVPKSNLTDLETAYSNESEMGELVHEYIGRLFEYQGREHASGLEKIRGIIIPDLRALIQEFDRQVASDPRWEKTSKPRMFLSHCRIEDANAIRASFDTDLVFDRCEFTGRSMFTLAEFKRDLVMSECVFAQIFLMPEAKFRQKSIFNACLFYGGVHANRASFEQEADFLQSVILKPSTFCLTHFKGGANFQSANVQSLLNFTDAEFSKFLGLHFASSSIGKHAARVRLINARFQPGSTIDVQESHLKFKVDVLEEIIERDSTSFTSWFVEYFELVFRGPLEWFGLCRTGVFVCGEDEGTQYSETRRELFWAAQDYALLRDIFRSQPAAEHLEDICAWKHRELRRASQEPVPFPGRVLQLVQLIFDWLVLRTSLGYLIQPSRIAISSLSVILAFALIYWKFASESTLSMGGFSGDPEILISAWNADSDGKLSALYFSITTFVTLGYGDFAPVGWFKLLTGIEALLGVSLLALFTVAWARKMVR